MESVMAQAAQIQELLDKVSRLSERVGYLEDEVNRLTIVSGTMDDGYEIELLVGSFDDDD